MVNWANCSARKTGYSRSGACRRVATTTRHIGHVPWTRVARLGGERHAAVAEACGSRAPGRRACSRGSRRPSRTRSGRSSRCARRAGRRSATGARRGRGGRPGPGAAGVGEMGDLERHGPSSLEKRLRDEAFWPRAGWDREHRAADVARVGVQGVVFGQLVLQRDELAARVAHEGEEEQAVVGVEAAAQDGQPWLRAGPRRGCGCLGRSCSRCGALVEPAAGRAGLLLRLSRPMIRSCSALREAVPRVQDRGCGARTRNVPPSIAVRSRPVTHTWRSRSRGRRRLSVPRGSRARRLGAAAALHPAGSAPAKRLGGLVGGDEDAQVAAAERGVEGVAGEGGKRRRPRGARAPVERRRRRARSSPSARRRASRARHRPSTRSRQRREIVGRVVGDQRGRARAAASRCPAGASPNTVGGRRSGPVRPARLRARAIAHPVHKGRPYRTYLEVLVNVWRSRSGAESSVGPSVSPPVTYEIDAPPRPAAGRSLPPWPAGRPLRAWQQAAAAAVLRPRRRRLPGLGHARRRQDHLRPARRPPDALRGPRRARRRRRADHPHLPPVGRRRRPLRHRPRAQPAERRRARSRATATASPSPTRRSRPGPRCTGAAAPSGRRC